MTVDLFGYKLEVEILILIAVIYLIMMFHIFLSVTKVNGVEEFVKEGFESLKKLRN